MAQNHVIEVESEVKCGADKMFHLIKNKFHHLPEIFPETYKGSEIIEGDGTKNGCVRIWHYVLPDSPELLFVKCKNEDLADDKMTIGLNVIGGDILNFYTRFVLTITVIPKSEGCLVKWTIKYQKVHEEIADPHHYLELFSKLGEKLEAHILNEFNMAQNHVIEVESEAKCDADKMFHLIKNKLHHLPEIFPETYKGSEIIEGDGTKNGCVRIWHYVLPDSPELLFVKCKNEDLADDKMTIGLNVIGGDILNFYTRFVLTITVTPKDEGCLVKWTIKYQKVHEEIADPHHYLELFSKLGEKLEAHILNEFK